jgi:hypothetical protein
MTSKTTPAAGGPARSPAWSPALPTRAAATRPSILTWAADLESTGARRGLQIALGLIWLLDAALQFQPYMFGRAFVSQVLEPTAAGNPAVFASPALWADRLITHGLPAWNTAFALIQLAIAVGLLWRPAVKAALAVSVVWSLGVWWVAEGLGGVLTGTASPVTGAPGAVILYALLAILLWPPHSGTPGDNGAGHGGAAAASPLGSRWSRVAWLVLWGSFAYLVLQPAVRAARALSGILAGEAAGEPGWLAAVDRGAAAAAGSHGLAISVVLAAAFMLIATGIAFPATTRPALILAMIIGLGIWVIGENFGEIPTGTATDPNTGPLLILLAAAYWSPDHHRRPNRYRLGSAHWLSQTNSPSPARPSDGRPPDHT